jgi:hypothetical protein
METATPYNLQRCAEQILASCRPTTSFEPVTFSAAPILLSLTLHCWGLWVFNLHPMRRAPRAIGRAESLQNDPLTAKSAGLAKHNCAVLLDMLIEDEAQMRAV